MVNTKIVTKYSQISLYRSKWAEMASMVLALTGFHPSALDKHAGALKTRQPAMI